MRAAARSPRMPRALAWAAVVLACLAPALLGAPSARADDPAAWMFTPSEVVGIDLTLGDEAIAALAVAPKDYVPAGFELHGSDGRVFGPWTISLKLKGNGSFRTLAGKAAFKLKFPASTRPSGLRKLTLNNMTQDSSKVRETLAYTVFRAMGVPAPRTGYAQVRVNGEDYGLYLNVETLDAVAMANWFPATGHLYESMYDYEDGGSPLSTLEPGGEAFFEVVEGDDAERSDLQGLIAALHDEAPGDLATVLGDHADLDEIARMLGTEAFTGHWDGYGWNVNNFFLHADPAGRVSLLPWGADQTFQTSFPLQGGPWPAKGILLARCLADDACAAARAAAESRARGLASTLDLAGMARDLRDRLRPLIAVDPRSEQTVTEVEAAVDDVLVFLAARAPFAPPEPAPRTAGLDVPPPEPAPEPAPAPLAAPVPPELTAARARAAVRRVLRVRFRGARATRITCAPVGPDVRHCRARWVVRGVRWDRRVVVRLGPDGRLASLGG